MKIRILYQPISLSSLPLKSYFCLYQLGPRSCHRRAEGIYFLAVPSDMLVVHAFSISKKVNCSEEFIEDRNSILLNLNRVLSAQCREIKRAKRD